MICSILLPTRKRVERLKRCLDSLSTTAKVENYEVLLAIDNDDEEMIRAIPFFNNPPVRYTIAPRGSGWMALDKRNDELSSIARSLWLWMMNDDVTIEGYGWDEQLKTIPTTGVLVQPQTMKLGGSTYSNLEWTCFPIFPKGCLEKLGKSLHGLNPADQGIWEFLVKTHGWKTHHLKGITANHQRDSDDKIAQHRL